MATLDITDVRPNGNSFAEGRLNPPDEVWAPPLAPNGTTAVASVLLHEDTFRPAIGGEDPFQPPEPSNLSQTFRSPRKLIAGTAIIAAFGVAGLTYFFLASPAAKVPAETAESSATAVQSPEPSSPKVESSSETPVQPAPAVAEPSRGASGAVPSPDVAASLTKGASPLVAPGGCDDPNYLRGPESGLRLFAASRRKHQVCTLRKRARSGDCPQRHAVYSFKPGGRLGPGREHSREGLDQFPIPGA